MKSGRPGYKLNFGSFFPFPTAVFVLGIQNRIWFPSGGDSMGRLLAISSTPISNLQHTCYVNLFEATEARRAADETFTMRASAGVNPAHRNVVLAMQPGSLGQFTESHHNLPGS